MSRKLDWSKAKKQSYTTLYYRPTGLEEEQARQRRLKEEREYEQWSSSKIDADGQVWLLEQLATETDVNKQKALQWVAKKSREQNWPSAKIKPVVLSLYAKGFVDDGRVPSPSVTNRQPNNHPMLKDQA